MQALFYIGLFGTFFFVMSSITVGVSMSTMQEMVNQQKNVERMFRDVDFAINRIILREFPSLRVYSQVNGLAPNLENIAFTAQYLSWSPQQLQQDPWRSNIQVQRIQQTEVIAGGNVQAEVDYFILASAGVDRIMETDLTGINNANDWRIFRSIGASGDDIIHTFSTKDALLRVWNEAVRTEEEITEIAQQKYARKVEQVNIKFGRVFDKMATCAVHGVLDASTLRNLDCRPSTHGYTAALVNECHQVSQGATPNSLQFLPNTDVSVEDCWKYDPALQADPEFPSMAGNMNLFNTPDTVGVINELGLVVQFQNDPFATPNTPLGNIIFEQQGNHPHELVLGRSASIIPGWDFTGRQTIISPE